MYLPPFPVIFVGCFGTLVVLGQGLQLGLAVCKALFIKLRFFWKIVYVFFECVPPRGKLLSSNCREGSVVYLLKG